MLSANFKPKITATAWLSCILFLHFCYWRLHAFSE